jgi:stage V sporulation protein R
MLDQMANHATFVRRAINEIGTDPVESFLDTCLSIENLIDITAPYRAAPINVGKTDLGADEVVQVPKIETKGYLDSYINPKDFLDAQKTRLQKEQSKTKNFPERPERDVLKFLINNAPIASWQKRILEIVRDESYYFAPQGQTKIMNEGWATYWHSMMMTRLSPLHGSEIVDYCDHYSGVVAAAPGSRSSPPTRWIWWCWRSSAAAAGARAGSPTSTWARATRPAPAALPWSARPSRA